jgi:hypothetical protein
MIIIYSENKILFNDIKHNKSFFSNAYKTIPYHKKMSFIEFLKNNLRNKVNLRTNRIFK